jgi:hypothetical protein
MLVQSIIFHFKGGPGEKIILRILCFTSYNGTRFMPQPFKTVCFIQNVQFVKKTLVKDNNYETNILLEII